jgi:hypothetical protein
MQSFGVPPREPAKQTAMSTLLHDRGALPGCLALVHTPEVNQSEGPGPPHWEAGGRTPAFCFFHRAIRSLLAALFPGTGRATYVRFTQLSV